MIKQLLSTPFHFHFPGPSRATGAAAGESFQAGSIVPPEAVRPSIKPWDDHQEPAVLLSRDDAQGKVTLGNVRWGFIEEGQNPSQDWKPMFRDTTIDIDKVRSVKVMIRPIDTKFSHVLIGYEFEPGYGVQSATGETDGGLCFSMEARLRKGETWSIGAQAPSIYQVGTMSDAVQKACRMRGIPTEFHTLNRTHDQVKAMLQESISEALKDHRNDIYNAYNNNCDGAAVHQINATMPADAQMGEWLIPGKVHQPLSAIPQFLPTLLDSYNLLADPAPTVVESSGPAPAWLKAPQAGLLTRFLMPVLDVTSHAAAALLPAGTLPAALEGPYRLVTGQLLDHLLHRRADRHVVSSDTYAIPPQTAATLATSAVHSTNW